MRVVGQKLSGDLGLELKKEWALLRQRLYTEVASSALRQEQLISAAAGCNITTGDRLNGSPPAGQGRASPLATPLSQTASACGRLQTANSMSSVGSEEEENSQLAPSPAIQEHHRRKGRKTQKTLVKPVWKTDEKNADTGMKKRVVDWWDWWMDIEEPERFGFLALLVHSIFFQATCAIVIILNGVYAVYVANKEVQHPGQARKDWEIAIELFFLSFYALELLVKAFVHRLFIFANADMYWNAFDFALVLFTLYDEFGTIFSLEDIASDVTFMRTLRVLKMAKVLRVVRVMRYFSELRLILSSLMGSVSSLFWSMVMMGLIFYIFALCFVQGVATFMLPENVSEQPDEIVQEILSKFGSVQVAMLSLYKCSAGGDDWSGYLELCMYLGNIYNCLFIFFVAFIQIALFNILTAIFVENAMKLAQPDRDARALEVRKTEMQEKEELRRLCRALDKNHDGNLDIEEFSKHLERGKMKAYLHVLGLDIRDPGVFLRLLSSRTEDIPIEIEAFVEGCMRMKGDASSIDMQGVLYEVRVISQSVRLLHDQQAAIFNQLGDVQGRLGEAANSFGVSEGRLDELDEDLTRSRPGAASL